MKNRGIIARILAKTKKQKAPKKAKKAPEPVKKILAIDPETGKVVLEINKFEDAPALGFTPNNIKSALKTGKKYKGHLWELTK